MAASFFPEILEKIFSHLGQQDKASCSQVCQSWGEACDVPSLWKTEEVRLDPDRLSDDVIQRLIKRQVGHVVFTRECSGKALKSLLKGLPSIHHLELRLAKGLDISEFVQGFEVDLSCLKTLKIQYDTRRTACPVLDLLFHCASNLEDFTLEVASTLDNFTYDYNNKTGRAFFQRYSSRMRKLKRLSLITGMLSDEGLRLLTGTHPHSPEESDVSSLEHLHLCDNDEWTISDSVLESVAKGFPVLKSLRCAWERLNCCGLVYLRQFPHLEIFSMQCCRSFRSEVGRLDLCSSTVKFFQLDKPSGWNQADFLNLPKCFPSLTHMHIGEGELLTEVILILFSRLTNLQVLKLGYTTPVLQAALKQRFGTRVSFEGYSIILQRP